MNSPAGFLQTEGMHPPTLPRSDTGELEKGFSVKAVDRRDIKREA